MKSAVFFIFGFMLLLTFSCGKKKESAPTAPPSTAIVADSICFSRHIEPLLAICATCHNIIRAPLTTTLIGYDNIKTNIDAIIAATQAGRMPKNGPRFSQGAVDTLSAWRTNGEKNCAP